MFQSLLLAAALLGSPDTLMAAKAADSRAVDSACGVDVKLVEGRPHLSSQAPELNLDINDGSDTSLYLVQQGKWASFSEELKADGLKHLVRKDLPGDGIIVPLNTHVGLIGQPDNACGFWIRRDDGGIYVTFSTFFTDHRDHTVTNEGKTYLR